MIKYVLMFLMIPLLILGQDPEEENLWKPFEFLIGSWIGDVTGKSGIGKGERTYEFILNKKYIKMENASRFKPQEKNPEGETHQDLNVFSKDNIKNLFVLRQFTSKGYVNTFVLDTLNSENRKLIFITETSEESSKGLRTRLTYRIISKDEFTEIFELASPGKDFEIWLRNFWRRKLQ